MLKIHLLPNILKKSHFKPTCYTEKSGNTATVYISAVLQRENQDAAKSVFLNFSLNHL